MLQAKDVMLDGVTPKSIFGWQTPSASANASPSMLQGDSSITGLSAASVTHLQSAPTVCVSSACDCTVLVSVSVYDEVHMERPSYALQQAAWPRAPHGNSTQVWPWHLQTGRCSTWRQTSSAVGEF